jgi:hypothetical protein
MSAFINSGCSACLDVFTVLSSRRVSVWPGIRSVSHKWLPETFSALHGRLPQLGRRLMILTADQLTLDLSRGG